MPFTLAHPAIVLPLRRWCPRYFDFAALIVGSIVPDLAACINDGEYFSHSLTGMILFGLPAGCLTLWILHRVGAALVSTMPARHRDALLPLCAGEQGPVYISILSLMLGQILHIGWDQLTHDYGWLARHSALGSYHVGSLAMNRFLWLVSSVLGSAIVLGYYAWSVRRAYQPRAHRDSALPSPSDLRAYLRWCVFLLIPFLGAVPLTFHETHHSGFGLSTARIMAMYYLGCGYVTFALIGFAARWLRSKG